MADGKRRTTRFVSAGGRSDRDKLMERMAAMNGTTAPERPVRESDISKLADFLTRPPRASERSDRPTKEASKSGGSGGFDFSRLNDVIQNMGNIVTGASRMAAARYRAVPGLPSQADGGGGTSIGDTIDWLRFDEPNLADYMTPYDQAESAANESFTRGKEVISGAYGTLAERLKAEQARYGDRTQAADAELAMARRLSAGAEEATLGGALSADLGIDPALRAEAEMLSQIRDQADQGADLAAQERRATQAATDESTMQGVGASEAAAQATAAMNLQSLLNQIGLGRAEAKGKYTSDLNNVRAQNQQNEMAAREQALKLQQDEQKAAEDFAREQQGYVKDATVDAWGPENVALRRQNNPKATDFFLTFIDGVGGARTAAGQNRASKMLGNALTEYQRATGTRLNAKVIQNWLDEYYGKKKVFMPDAYRGDRDWAMQNGLL